MSCLTAMLDLPDATMRAVLFARGQGRTSRMLGLGRRRYLASMPSQVDQQHEHDAIDGLCAELTVRGRSSRVTSWPDCDPTADLTVDAVADVDGTRWVIEHCRLTAWSTFPAMARAVREALQGPLNDVAASIGHFITLSVLPVTGSPPQRRNYYEATLANLRKVATQGPGFYPLADDAFTTATVHETAAIGGAQSTMSVWVSDGSSAALLEQLQTAMEHAWEKKLSKQLPPARSAGYRVLLLLDMIAAPDQQTPPQLLASASTVAQAIQDTLDRHPGVLDEVWLRNRDGSYEPLPVQLDLPGY